MANKTNQNKTKKKNGNRVSMDNNKQHGHMAPAASAHENTHEANETGDGSFRENDEPAAPEAKHGRGSANQSPSKSNKAAANVQRLGHEPTDTSGQRTQVGAERVERVPQQAQEEGEVAGEQGNKAKNAAGNKAQGAEAMASHTAQATAQPIHQPMADTSNSMEGGMPGAHQNAASMHQSDEEEEAIEEEAQAAAQPMQQAMAGTSNNIEGAMPGAHQNASSVCQNDKEGATPDEATTMLPTEPGHLVQVGTGGPSTGMVYVGKALGLVASTAGVAVGLAQAMGGIAAGGVQLAMDTTLWTTRTAAAMTVDGVKASLGMAVAAPRNMLKMVGGVLGSRTHEANHLENSNQQGQELGEDGEKTGQADSSMANASNSHAEPLTGQGQDLMCN